LETLRDLTGAPTFEYKIREELEDEEDLLWDRLQKWD
jgi:hypothetical protein